jgi:hypothetical protein
MSGLQQIGDKEECRTIPKFQKYISRTMGIKPEGFPDSRNKNSWKLRPRGRRPAAAKNIYANLSSIFIFSVFVKVFIGGLRRAFQSGRS